MSDAPLEEVVGQLADREAIRELTARYCHLIWKRDPVALADLFAPDGEFRSGDAVAVRGRAAIVEWYSQLDRETRPFVHHNVITLNGSRATGTCELDVRSVRDGRRTLGIGTYDDAYIRVN